MIIATLLTIAFLATPADVFAAETHEVEILRGSTTLGDKSYAPNPVDIAKGDTIRFVNSDSVLHTATSGDGQSATNSGVFDSGFLGPNRSAEVTINEAGEFPYYCQAHPTMVGLVRVSEGPGSGGQFKTIANHDGVDYEVTGTSTSAARAIQAVITPGTSVRVTFEGSGDVNLVLPTSMIEGISTVTTASGESVNFSVVEESETTTTISFAVPAGDDPSVVIMGARVIPEFGIISAGIIGASLTGLWIVISRAFRSGTGKVF